MIKYFNLKVSSIDENRELYPRLDSSKLNKQLKIIGSLNKNNFESIKEKLNNLKFDLEFFEDSYCEDVPDVLRWDDLKTEHLVISRRFRNLLFDFNIHDSKFLPCVISKKDQHLDYYIFINFCEFEEYIDFYRSSFIERDFNTQKIVSPSIIKVESYLEYRDMAKTFFLKSMKSVLGLKSLFLNSKRLDYFILPYLPGAVISDKLRATIIGHGITGVKLNELEELDISFDEN